MAKALVENQKRNLSTAGGSIVNMSSIIGKSGAINHANYSASKAGVIGLTKTVAQELSHYNIRCNAVLPGVIITPMSDIISDELKKSIMNDIPLGRFGKPEGWKRYFKHESLVCTLIVTIITYKHESLVCTLIVTIITYRGG